MRVIWRPTTLEGSPSTKARQRNADRQAMQLLGGLLPGRDRSTLRTTTEYRPEQTH